MRIISGYQNTKDNKEDLALTPYIFIVNGSFSIVKVYGIGLCWLHHSFYITLGFNIPEEFKFFTNHSKHKQ